MSHSLSLVVGRCEDVSSESLTTVSFVCGHRLDEANLRRWVEPEQSVRRDLASCVEDREVEVGSVQRRLLQTLRDIRSVAGDEVVWTGACLST